MSVKDACVCASVLVTASDGRPKAFVWAGDDGHGDTSVCEVAEWVLVNSGEEWSEAACEEVTAMCAQCSMRPAGYNGVEVVRV